MDDDLIESCPGLLDVWIASRGKRVARALLDGVLLVCTALALVAGVAWLGGWGDLGSESFEWENFGRLPVSAGVSLGAGVAVTGLVGALWASTGRGPVDFLLGLRTVRADTGGRPGGRAFGLAVAVGLAGLASCGLVPLAGAIAGRDPDGRHWLDRWAGLAVIDVRQGRDVTRDSPTMAEWRERKSPVRPAKEAIVEVRPEAGFDGHRFPAELARGPTDVKLREGMPIGCAEPAHARTGSTRAPAEHDARRAIPLVESCDPLALIRANTGPRRAASEDVLEPRRSRLDPGLDVPSPGEVADAMRESRPGATREPVSRCREVTPRQVSPRQVSPRQVAPREGSPREASPREMSPHEATGMVLEPEGWEADSSDAGPNPFAAIWGHTITSSVEEAAIRQLTPDEEAVAGEPAQAEPSALGHAVVGATSVAIAGTVVIGRAPQALPGEECALLRVVSPDRGISRSHAVLRVRGRQVLASDLCSSNGTWLRRPGRPDLTVTDRPLPVHDGDALDLGEGVEVALVGVP